MALSCHGRGQQAAWAAIRREVSSGGGRVAVRVRLVSRSSLACVVPFAGRARRPDQIGALARALTLCELGQCERGHFIEGRRPDTYRLRLISANGQARAVLGVGGRRAGGRASVELTSKWRHSQVARQQ